jgi:hypothetical protein
LQLQLWKILDNIRAEDVTLLCYGTVFQMFFVALADCVTLYQDAASGLLSTGWISSLIQLLIDVKGNLPVYRVAEEAKFIFLRDLLILR